MKYRQAEEDRLVDSLAAASEAPEDMTYAQLNHLALRGETTPPSSQSEDPPSEPRYSLPGLCQGPWDCVQAGSLPKPSIWADSGPMVTTGSPVTIWCQGSLQADVYHLYKERISKPLATEAPLDSSNKISFSIESMSSHTAGIFQSHPGRVVAKGGNVSLSCSSESPLDIFHLLKEGGADPPRHMELTTYLGMWQAVFTVGPVNASHGGTYRCYGSPSSYSFVWSHPSNPLHLEVTEAADNISPSQNKSDSKNYTVENHIRIGLAALILVVLGILLFQACHSTRRPQDTAR
ncbi:hypothetical protein HPG69_013921, partial [Diceros bicornis minor]